MTEDILLVVLYDYYQDLLTDKQREYFEGYYFQNFTLAELSEQYSISRNAVHKQLKIVCDKLFFFEDKLKLYHKAEAIKKVLKKIDNEEIVKKIEELI
jgi:predicted DNA-binding protein YlxM (UPF0122 family)